jgi:hypothetical protein
VHGDFADDGLGHVPGHAAGRRLVHSSTRADARLWKPWRVRLPVRRHGYSRAYLPHGVRRRSGQLSARRIRVHADRHVRHGGRLSRNSPAKRLRDVSSRSRRNAEHRVRSLGLPRRKVQRRLLRSVVAARLPGRAWLSVVLLSVFRQVVRSRHGLRYLQPFRKLLHESDDWRVDPR